MTPLEVVAAGPYNLFYTFAVAAAAASMFVAGRRRGWSASGWAMAVAAWASAGMVGAMIPHLLFGDGVAYRTSIGAVIFSTLALGLIARALSRDIGEVVDTTAVGIPLGASIVRVGCFLAECCQGVATSLPIGIALHADDVPRHPVQLYEAILEFALAMAIARPKGAGSPARPGRQFATSIAGMCAIRFATEFVRDNDKYNGLSLAQWIVLPMGVLCLILLLSRGRAPRPRRVLTTGARHATIGLIGALALGAVAVGLPALESTVLVIGVALLVVVAIRRIGGVAPTGLAVLALQMPSIGADSTYPRVTRFFGAGATMGVWDYVHQYADCEGTVDEEWTRRHQATGASFEAGVRKQTSATRGAGFRGRAYYGSDKASAAVVKRGTPASPGPYTRVSTGAQFVGDVDWKWVGLSLGFSAGTFYPMLEADYGPGEEFDSVDIFPAVGLRVGPLRGASVELRVADESPMWIPGPSVTFALGLGDGAGNRIRIGSTEAGIIVAGNKVTAGGLEIIPTFVFDAGNNVEATKVFQGGLTFRKWIRVGPQPPAGK